MNPITKTEGFKVGTLLLATLEDAQREALKQLVEDNAKNTQAADDFAALCITHSDEIVAILTPGEELAPKVRKTRKDIGTQRGPRQGKVTVASVKKAPQVPAENSGM
jgi:hypothetical protein